MIPGSVAERTETTASVSVCAARTSIPAAAPACDATAWSASVASDGGTIEATDALTTEFVGCVGAAPTERDSVGARVAVATGEEASSARTVAATGNACAVPAKTVAALSATGEAALPGAETTGGTTTAFWFSRR